MTTEHAEVQGTCQPQYEPVRKLMQEMVDNGEELGASLCVDVGGEPVLDLWGGWKDQARTQSWERDTIVNVWSCSKTVTTLAALMCVDRGLLDVDAPVAEYWPEFAANGKEQVLVRHLMGHTSGVSGWDQPFTVQDMCDVPAATARLAEQAPWWEPGTASGYHASSQGHLVGELVRRTSGLTLGDFVDQEIAGPLGADVQLGAREQDRDRIANVVPPPPLAIDLSALDPQGPTIRTLTGPATDARQANTPLWRNAQMGAVNGHTNARGLATVLSTVTLGGGRGGTRLLSSETLDLVWREQSNGVDLVLGVPLRFGIGMGLPNASIPYVTGDRVCFWGGWGGSLIVMDQPRRQTIGYAMNKMGAGIIGSDRSQAYMQAIAQAQA